MRVRTGTARRQRGIDRVNKILEAAKTLFLNEGYAGLRLRRVAEMADISLGNLTYYFSSKADLFESMIDKVLTEYSQKSDEFLKLYANNPEERANSYFGFLFADCQNTETQQFFYQFWATAAHDDFVAAAREKVYAVFHEQVLDICRQVNPSLKDDTRAKRAYLLMALVEGLHVILGSRKQPNPVLEGLESEFQRQVRHIIHS